MRGLKSFFCFSITLPGQVLELALLQCSHPLNLFTTCSLQADVYHNLLKICPWVMNLACAITGNGIWLHLLVPLLAQCCFFGVSCLTQLPLMQVSTIWREKHSCNDFIQEMAVGLFLRVRTQAYFQKIIWKQKGLECAPPCTFSLPSPTCRPLSRQTRSRMSHVVPVEE